MWINTTTSKVLQTHSDIRQDAGNISFPSAITEAMLAAYGYATIAPTLPSYNPATEKPAELPPANIAGIWTQQWQAVAMTAPELAAKAAADALIAKAGKDNADAGNAKADAKLMAFAAMTPAQVRTWVAANVATLADAKDALATLAVAVSILARRL